MALVTYEGVESGEDYANLIKLCNVVFSRHYNIYFQHKEEMIANAITDVYGALPLYDKDKSLINYLYTVIRNSYTKDVNKYKRTFVREDSEFRNEVANVETPTLELSSKIINEVCDRMKLNKHHKYYLINGIINNGVRIDRPYSIDFKPKMINDADELYLSRVASIIMYEHKARELI